MTAMSFSSTALLILVFITAVKALSTGVEKQDVTECMQRGSGLEDLDSELELDLAERKLTSWPDDIDVRTTSLDLSQNDLKSVPGHVDKLKRLVCLVLTGNRLACLPINTSQLKFLKKLYLSDNNLVNFPYPIVGLVELEVLDLSANKLSELPDEFYNLVKLKTLYLSCNKLGKLSDDIGNLVALKKFIISGNMFYSLPDNICKLVLLEELFLHDNRLEKLPDDFKEFMRLTHCDVSYDNNNLSDEWMSWFDDIFAEGSSSDSESEPGHDLEQPNSQKALQVVQRLRSIVGCGSNLEAFDKIQKMLELLLLPSSSVSSELLEGSGLYDPTPGEIQTVLPVLQAFRALFVVVDPTDSHIRFLDEVLKVMQSEHEFASNSDDRESEPDLPNRSDSKEGSEELDLLERDFEKPNSLP